MLKEFLTIYSNCDGLPLSTAIFIPEEEVKGIVQISHGMAEHKERYFSFMEYLTERNYVVVINDHRGHGESVRDKNDLGYFYDESGEYIVKDLHQITLYMKERFPGKPVYLFGHSMGSMAVRMYIKKYDSEIDKLIVCGSPSKNPLVDVALFVVRFQKLFKGDRYRSRLIQNLAFGSYNKNIDKPISDNAWLSSDENNVKNYDSDDLCGFIFTLNGFRNLFLLMKEIYITSGWALKNKDLPIMFIAGRDDPVIVSEDKWNESREFLKKLGYTNVRGKLYKGLRHEILNENIKENIYDDIVKFMLE
ncbi:MAG: alpha/beta hydrolase [Firmicutes bacterium]|jgi:alpha-beta hydrolase superfamily lysophospholipase|nr:alpha/beta hydrolase [Bacillota bacterium]